MGWLPTSRRPTDSVKVYVQQGMDSATSINGGFRHLSKEDRRKSLLVFAVLGVLLAGQFALVFWLFLTHS